MTQRPNIQLRRRHCLSHSWILLVSTHVLTGTCFAAGPDQTTYPSEAPMVNGFNDVNAIRYDTAHETQLERMEQEWTPSDDEEKYGYAATVHAGGGNQQVEKEVRYYAGDALPLGVRFLAGNLVHFLDRRADGDLREGQVKSKFLARDVRAVIQMCGEAEVKSALPAMLKLLSDPNKQIQSATYRWIACIGPDSPAVFEALSKTLAEGRMTHEIAENMHRFGARGLPLLVKAIERHPDPVMIDSLMSFSAIGQDTVAALIRQLESKDVNILIAAEFTLAHFSPEAQSAIPALLKLHARREHYDDIGYDALARMGKKATGAMLADARLAGGTYAEAMRALAGAKSYEQAIPILIDGLRHPDARVRYAAAMSLHGAAATPAVGELIRCLNDPDAAVQREAALALGGIGRGAEPAIPALQAAAVRNSHGDMYSAATSAIMEIRWYLRR